METSSNDPHNHETAADLKSQSIPMALDNPSVPPSDRKPPSVQSFTNNDLMDASQGSSISFSVPVAMQQQGIIASKPIKKKTPIAIDAEEEDDDHHHHHTAAAMPGSASHSNHGKQQQMMMSAHTQQGSSSSSSSLNVKDLEVQARRDLQQFLSTKHIDPRASDGYSVHIRMQPRKRTIDGYMRSSNSSNNAAAASSSSSGYSVTYSAPDGSILTSKADILNSILEALKRRTQHLSQQAQGRSSSSSSSSAVASTGDHSHLLSDTRYGVTTALAAQLTRTDAYELARKTYFFSDGAAAGDDGAGMVFPRAMDGITVLRPGRVDLRMGFHSLVQIYPVGYLCEQTVNCSSIARGSFSELVQCEVGDRDGYPEFCITVKAAVGGDTTFIASSEAAVWKKVWQ